MATIRTGYRSALIVVDVQADDAAEATMIEADNFVRELDAVSPWLSHPGCMNRAVAAAELVW